MSNLYWPIYKNLERECLQLANYVHFSDDQTDVYSMHIADLIVRCAIEIEAISKDLYQSIGGNMNPTDASGNSRDKNFCLDSAITRQRYSDSPEIKKYLAEHPEDQDKSINEVCMAAGGIALLQRIMSFQHTLQGKSARMEGILNKHSSIYPELFPPTTSSTL